MNNVRRLDLEAAAKGFKRGEFLCRPWDPSFLTAQILKT